MTGRVALASALVGLAASLALGCPRLAPLGDGGGGAGGSTAPATSGPGGSGGGGSSAGGGGQGGSTGVPLWPRSFGDAGRQWVNAVATTPDGGLVVVGGYEQGFELDDELLTAAGGHDGFVASLDAFGAVRWARHIGGGGDDEITAVTVDASGTVVVAGFHESEIQLGDNIAAPSPRNLFVAKLSADGADIWGKLIGSGSQAHTRPCWDMLDMTGDYIDVALDLDGNVAVAGTFVGSLALGGGVAGGNDDDAFVAKLDPNGNELWTRAFVQPEGQELFAVDVRPNGSLVVAGGYVGMASFGGGTFEDNPFPRLFVAEYRGSDGMHDWSVVVPDSFFAAPRAVVAFGGESWVVGCSFDGGIDYHDAMLTYLTAEGNQIAFMRFHPDDNQSATITDAVLSGDAGDIAAVGAFTGALDFGNGAMDAGASYDAFLAQIGSDFVASASTSWGDNANVQRAESVAIAADGAHFVAGRFTGTIAIGGAELTATGSDDIFVARIPP